MEKGLKRRGTIVLLLLVLGAAGLTWYTKSQRPAGAQSAENAFASPEQCRTCHAQIYRDYQQVGMARSFYPGASGIRPGTYVHKASGRHYEVVHRDGRVFQRRFELDENGREINAFELEATHAIGSGNHARTYLHRINDREIVELPLTWYSQEQAWGMSPGYDTANPQDFTRLIDESCLFCHNGYPRGGELAQGIDCQRCHGPGSRHVQLASAGKSDREQVRAAIVNPKRLSAELQMDVCMQCHLETTSAELPQAIRRFDREPFSYRPGEPLGSYVIHFDHPPGSGHDDKFEIVNQAYRLRKSACFLESKGQMTCSSCHNPHNVPRGADAVAYYRARCVACHDKVAAKEHPDLQTGDCASCHMPKRRAEDAVHVVMTDHLIQRRRPAQDLTRPLQERAVKYQGPLAVYLPTNLSDQERDEYLGVASVSGGADRRHGIQLLERSAKHGKALGVLGEGHFAEGNHDAAIRAFEKAVSAHADLPRARYNLGLALDIASRFDEARAAFEESLRLRPRSPEVEYALANLLARRGDTAGAELHYLAAIRERPVYVEARNNLANAYAAQGRLAEAATQLDQAVRIDPSHVEAHNNLARVLAMQGKAAEAVSHARRAVKIKPDHAEARYNLARLLQETGATEASFEEFRALIALRPSMVEAHLEYGQALGDAGRLDAAIAEFQQVLRLRPDHAEARKDLEMALEMKRSGGR